MTFRTIDFSTNITDADGSDGTIVVDGLKFTVTGAAAGYTFNLNGGRLNFSEASSNQQFIMTVTETSGSTFTLHDYTINYSGTPATATNAAATWEATVYVAEGGQSTSIPASSGTFHYTAAFGILDYPTASSMTIQDDHIGLDPALANPTSTFWLDNLVIQDTAPANTPPVVTAGAVAAYAERGTAAALDPGLTVTDADSSNLASASVSITSGFLSGDTLNFTNTANIIGSYDSTHGILTLTGTDTIADYHAALDSITFSSTNHNPTNFGADTDRTISWVANDGTAPSSTVTSTLHITPVNDAPVVTASGAVAAYTECGTAAALDPGLTITDADSLNLSSATVSITGGFLAGDTLNFTNTAHITGSYDSVHGILTLTGPDPIAVFKTALESITFSSTSHNPTNFGADASRTIAWQVNDGTVSNNLSNSGTTTINITAVNDAPVVTASGAVAAYTERGTAAVLDAGLTIIDADNTTLASTTASITGGFLAGDMLNFTNTAHITGSYDVTHGILTLTGSDSIADYQAALDAITFSSTSHDPTALGTDTSRIISWVANDGTDPSSTVTSTLNITAVNDAPVVTAGNTVGYGEQAAAIAVSPALSVTDADSPNFASATVIISAGLLAGDALHFTNQNGISGSFAAGVLTLSGSATVAQYQAALRSITFDNTTNDNPTNFGSDTSRTIAWQVNDGSGFNNLSNNDTTAINITAVNDAPVLHNVPAGVAFANGPAVILAPG